MKDNNYPILIDEEGEKFQGFQIFLVQKNFAPFFGNLYEKNKKNGKLIYKYYLDTICNILKDIGININTIPVMDLLQNSTHDIIKGRAYSNKHNTVKILGKYCISYLKKEKIGSIVKHVPGHGCSSQDSHLNLPVVLKGSNKLYQEDFKLFKNLGTFFMMTAHILYKKIDTKNLTTFSNTIIKKIIRKKLKFKGILISDDISMKALSKDLNLMLIKH